MRPINSVLHTHVHTEIFPALSFGYIYVACIGSHVCCVGYLSSFLLLCHSWIWIFGKFDSGWSWIIISLMDQLHSRSHLDGRLQGKGPAEKWVQQMLVATPPARDRQMNEEAKFPFFYCSVGVPWICCSVQDQREFQIERQLGPTTSSWPACWVLGAVWKMKTGTPCPIPGSTNGLLLLLSLRR